MPRLCFAPAVWGCLCTTVCDDAVLLCSRVAPCLSCVVAVSEALRASGVCGGGVAHEARNAAAAAEARGGGGGACADAATDAVRTGGGSSGHGAQQQQGGGPSSQLQGASSPDLVGVPPHPCSLNSAIGESFRRFGVRAGV